MAHACTVFPSPMASARIPPLGEPSGYAEYALYISLHIILYMYMYMYMYMYIYIYIMYSDRLFKPHSVSQ